MSILGGDDLGGTVYKLNLNLVRGEDLTESLLVHNLNCQNQLQCKGTHSVLLEEIFDTASELLH